MEAMKKTRWEAIALVIVLVLASGLTLAGCENGPGSARGFDPVGGTWRGTHTWYEYPVMWPGDVVQQPPVAWRSEETLTFHANGTGMWRSDLFRNNQFYSTWTHSFSYEVAGNSVFVFEGGVATHFTIADNNTLFFERVVFRRQ